MGNKLSHSDLRDGPAAVEARLRSGACPNARVHFQEPLGPLPARCPCTPLGYALIADDDALLDTLLAAGANPSKRVGLPCGWNLPPLHLAAALGRTDAIPRLIAAGADPAAQLDRCAGSSGNPLAWLLPHDDGERPLPEPLRELPTRCLAGGDTPLHLAADAGQCDAIRVLLKEPRTDINAPNWHNETPLYRAVTTFKSRGGAGPDCTDVLLAHPGVDVDAGGALFGAIEQQDIRLVRKLLRAGARVDRKMVNAAGHSPLAFCVYRDSWFFQSRADLVRELLKAGAVLEPGMVDYAEKRQWYRVWEALRDGLPAGKTVEAEERSEAKGGSGARYDGGVRCGKLAPRPPPLRLRTGLQPNVSVDIIIAPFVLLVHGLLVIVVVILVVVLVVLFAAGSSPE